MSYAWFGLSGTRFFAVLLLTFFGTLLHSGAAHALTAFPPFGGAGDHDVTDKCPSGQYLVGLSIRSGAWIDQMALTCAPVDLNNGSTGLPKDVLPPRGGNGGGSSSATCSPGFIIHGVALLMTAQNRQVRFFIFNCVSTTSSARHNLDLGPPVTIFPDIQQNCPAGEAVTGIRIRYGRHVNAVGLVCETFKQIEPPAPPAAKVECPETGDEVPSDWGDMLAAHNERRAEHCAPKLKWCSSLAQAAQAYADTCVLSHGNDPNTGENLADFWGEDSNGNPVLPAATDREAFENAWYCEVNNYDFNNPKFEGGFTTNCQRVNGHFTQVVWKDTTFLGCGRAECDIGGHKGTHWVCRYKPRGNVDVTDPFKLAQQVRRKPQPGEECPAP